MRSINTLNPNTGTPLVSVLLPVYNVSEFIEECLQSILKQTFAAFEILIIDDCSTDETIDKIATISDERIRIFQKERNCGLVHSLNLGMQLARGTYIARMDGDDFCTTDRFEKQLAVLQKNRFVKACGCWLQMFGYSNKIIKHKQFHDEIMVEMIDHCAMSLGSVMFDKEWALGCRFDEQKLHFEDYDFWSKAAWSGQLYNIQEVLYYYRTHQKQVSTLYNDVQRQGDIDVRLQLLNRIAVDSNRFDQNILRNVMLQKSFFTVHEFVIFNNWVKFLQNENAILKVFNVRNFVLKLDDMKRRIVFAIFFTNAIVGIDKKWRKNALTKLSISDVWFVFKLKFREFLKINLNKL